MCIVIFCIHSPFFDLTMNSFVWFQIFWQSPNKTPGFGISVKIRPRMRSSYAILSLFLVENFKMPTSELELAENTLFVLELMTFFKSQNIVFDPGFCINVKICPRMRSSYAFITLFGHKSSKKWVFGQKINTFGQKWRTSWQIYRIEMSNSYSFEKNLTSPYLKTFDVS